MMTGHRRESAGTSSLLAIGALALLVGSGCARNNRDLRDDRAAARSSKLAFNQYDPPRARRIRSSPRGAIPVSDAGKSKPQAPTSIGWRQLMYGQCYSALQSFRHEAKLCPDESEPKVGYALAAASIGNYSAGVWAMRRAFQTDPMGMEYLSLGDWSREPLESLAQRYEQFRYNDPADPDPAFMVAALHFLMNEPSAAREALGPPPRGGWKYVSTRHLDNMIEGRFASRIDEEADPYVGKAIASSVPQTPREKPSQPAPEAAVAEQPREAGRAIEGGVDAPREEVDYEEIRQGLMEAARAMDEFTSKLSRFLEERKPRQLQSTQAAAPNNAP